MRKGTFREARPAIPDVMRKSPATVPLIRVAVSLDPQSAGTVRVGSARRVKVRLAIRITRAAERTVMERRVGRNAAISPILRLSFVVIIDSDRTVTE